MPDDISIQILSQASDNIQKLFDLSTRIDERVKSIQSQYENMDRRIEEMSRRHFDILQKLALLEQKQIGDAELPELIGDCEEAIRSLDGRLNMLEGAKGRSEDRWNKIGSFVIQLIWVILAAYLLTKLNLQAPAVPG
jgi:hypothetical protein